MKVFLIFIALVTFLVGIIILALKYFKWLLKTKQKGDTSKRVNIGNGKKQ